MGFKLQAVNEIPKDAKPINFDQKPKIRIVKYDTVANGGLEDTKPLYTAPDFKSGSIGSFFKGWTKTFDNLASGVNWLGEKATSLVGLDSAKNFFHQNREFWNKQSKLNDLQTENHPVAHFAGEILNPTLLLPAGYFSKGKVVADVAKSALAGGTISGMEQGLEVAGRDDLTPEEKRNRVLTAVAFGGLGNVVFRGGEHLWGKVFNKNPKVADELHDAIAENNQDKIKEIVTAIKAKPEAFGLTKEEAQKFDIIPYEKPIKPDVFPETPDVIEMGHNPMLVNKGLIEDKRPDFIAYPQDKPKLPRFLNDDNIINLHYDPFTKKMIETKPLPENTEYVYSTTPYITKKTQNKNTEYPELINNLTQWDTNKIKNASLEELQQHPFYNNLIDVLKDVKASDKRYAQKKVQDRFFDREKGVFIGGLYEPNYLADYKLSKSSVQRILKGKPTEDDLQKLKDDLLYETERTLHSYKTNPDVFKPEANEELNLKAQAEKALEEKDYDTLEKILPNIQDEDFKTKIASELSSIPDEKAGNIASQYLFANANQRLAGGMLGGTYNSLENADENNDNYVTDEERMNAFLKGFGIGMLSPEALKVLKKTAPNTYAKLEALAKTNTNGQVAGSLFGKGVKKTEKNPYEYLEKYTESQKQTNWLPIDNSIMGNLRRLFKNTRSGEYEKAFQQMKIDQNKYNDLMENLHKALNELPQEAKADLIDYIENVKGKDYAPEIKELGEYFKSTIKSIQNELKEAGFNPEYIDKYGVNYVARLYKDKLGVKRLSDVLRGAKDKIYTPKGERGKVEILSEKQLQEKINNGEINPDMVGKPLIDGGIEIIPLANKKGYYKVKRDWTPEERAEMGQIKDADVVLPLTLMRLNSMKVMKDFFERVKGIDGAWVDVKEYAEKAGLPLKQAEVELKEQGFVKLPDNESYGALAGRWVRKDVADDIKYAHNMVFEDNALKETWRKYLTAWKKSKTIYNTSAHFNNFVNNLALSWYAGMPLKDIPKYYTQAFKELKKVKEYKDLEAKFLQGKATEEEVRKLHQLKNDLKYFIEAKNTGLLDTSMIRDILDFGRKEDSAENLIGSDSKLGKVAKFANDMYQAEDNIAKLAMYRALREKGYSPKKAHEMVTIFMPDYTKTLPAGIRFLRDSAISPFISWSYYVVPHLFRYTLGDVFKGIKNKSVSQTVKALNNPAMRKLFGLIAFIEGLQYALTNGKVSPFADINPNDETKPANTRFIRMGIGENNGIVNTLKIDRLLPQTMLIPSQWTGQFQQTFSGITPSFFSALTGTKLYNGRPVTYDSRPVPRQIYDWLKYVTESYAPVPATATQAWDTFIDPMIKKALYPNQRKRGVQLYQDRTTGQNILKLLTGINTLSYDQNELKREIERKKKKH